jgi:hypothetical protein
MDQNNPLPALTPDEVRVGAWAEVREPLELQLAPLRLGLLHEVVPNADVAILVDPSFPGANSSSERSRARDLASTFSTSAG